MLDLALSLLRETYLTRTSISSLGDTLVDLVLSLFTMTCLALPFFLWTWCRLGFTIVCRCLLYLHFLNWMVWVWTFLYRSTPSFGQNRMNLVFQDLVLFRLILWHALKRLTIRESKYGSQKVSLLKDEHITLWCGWQTYPCLATLLFYKSLEMTIMTHYWWYILRLLTRIYFRGIGVPSRC